MMENLTYSRIHKPKTINEIADQYLSVSTSKCRKNKKTIEYYNLSVAFDIETSSFYNPDKTSIMYIWQMCIGDEVIMGRYWWEFKMVIESLSSKFNTSAEKRLCIFVHNLSYEFQFIRKHFDWSFVFALDNRKVVSAMTTSGIEFRCSYVLSGYSLASLAKNLTKHSIKKMVGDLDYKLIRTPLTVLSDEELKYCENDVRIIVAYIDEKMETDGGMANILLTKTSYVRKFVKKACYSDDNYVKYRNLIEHLTLTTEEYELLKNGFGGGFTHAAKFNCNRVFENVRSCDFTSSYPAVALMEMFPMGKGQYTVIKDMNDYKYFAKNHCLIFNVEFTNLSLRAGINETPLSRSKCHKLESANIDNGRVLDCAKAITTITDVDLEVFTKAYTWDSMKIGKCYRYTKGYLPKPIIDSILTLYGTKTTLKGVKGSEVEYLNGKENLNSIYGAMVTDIIRDIIEYEDSDWTKTQGCIEGQIAEYNDSKSRFLYYPWGVWITAYARRNLWTGIIALGSDYIYSDTDSVKVTNYEQHELYFDKYNDIVKRKLTKMCNYYNIDINKCHPKNIKGEELWIGVWDTNDGKYNKFKTLGAKRYLVEKTDGEIEMTVSGVNKKIAVPYLLDKYGKDNIFNVFDDGLFFPQGFSGKNTHTYIDDEQVGIIKDIDGNEYEYQELSSVHIEESSYELSMSSEYRALLSLIQGQIIER